MRLEGEEEDEKISSLGFDDNNPHGGQTLACFSRYVLERAVFGKTRGACGAEPPIDDRDRHIVGCHLW
jgi:hypothetical protein